MSDCFKDRLVQVFDVLPNVSSPIDDIIQQSRNVRVHRESEGLMERLELVVEPTNLSVSLLFHIPLPIIKILLL